MLNAFSLGDNFSQLKVHVSFVHISARKFRELSRPGDYMFLYFHCNAHQRMLYI